MVILTAIDDYMLISIPSIKIMEKFMFINLNDIERELAQLHS